MSEIGKHGKVHFFSIIVALYVRQRRQFPFDRYIHWVCLSVIQFRVLFLFCYSLAIGQQLFLVVNVVSFFIVLHFCMAFFFFFVTRNLFLFCGFEDLLILSTFIKRYFWGVLGFLFTLGRLLWFCFCIRVFVYVFLKKFVLFLLCSKFFLDRNYRSSVVNRRRNQFTFHFKSLGGFSSSPVQGYEDFIVFLVFTRGDQCVLVSGTCHLLKLNRHRFY